MRRGLVACRYWLLVGVLTLQAAPVWSQHDECLTCGTDCWLFLEFYCRRECGFAGFCFGTWRCLNPAPPGCSDPEEEEEEEQKDEDDDCGLGPELLLLLPLLRAARERRARARS